MAVSTMSPLTERPRLPQTLHVHTHKDTEKHPTVESDDKNKKNKKRSIIFTVISLVLVVILAVAILL